MKTLPICMVCLILGTGTVAIIYAAEVEIVPDDRQQGEWFAFSVSISEGIAIVDAHLDTHMGGEKAGSACIFVRDRRAWIQQAKLTADDAEAGDNFGKSVAIHKNTDVLSFIE